MEKDKEMLMQTVSVLNASKRDLNVHNDELKKENQRLSCTLVDEDKGIKNTYIDNLLES